MSNGSGDLPALAKDPTDNRSLIAMFTAFKFPDSQIVRFNVIVRFCLEECEPVSRQSQLSYLRFYVYLWLFAISLKTVCRGGQLSYGRKRRSIEQPLNAEVTEIFKNMTPAELPLQLSIVVQSPMITADHLLSRENPVPDTILLASGSEFSLLLHLIIRYSYIFQKKTLETSILNVWLQEVSSP